MQDCEVTTPTGCQYLGLKYEKGTCGVSIVRCPINIFFMENDFNDEKLLNYTPFKSPFICIRITAVCFRSGEAMEKALQDCCRSLRIGKILVDSDSDTHEEHVVFAKFPDDIANRKVLLLYPIMSSGNKVCKAVQVLKEHQVPEEHIILINLFCTPAAARRVVDENPNMTVLTTELHSVTPNHFGQSYFGTDHVD